MEYKLGTNVEVGQQILTTHGWHRITEILSDGVLIGKDNCFIEFGTYISGWKQS